MGSPILTYAGSGRLTALHCIQCRLGAVWRSTQGKGIFPLTPCDALAIPPYWATQIHASDFTGTNPSKAVWPRNGGFEFGVCCCSWSLSGPIHLFPPPLKLHPFCPHPLPRLLPNNANIASQLMQGLDPAPLSGYELLCQLSQLQNSCKHLYGMYATLGGWCRGHAPVQQQDRIVL